jgi:DnaA-homolog protein
MRQLVLDLGAPPAPTLDNFVIGRNLELMQMLGRVSDGSVTRPEERCLYLWAEAGAGKTHLLKALAGPNPTASGARYLGPDDAVANFSYTPDTKLYLIDDCQRLSPQQQIAAFALFNQVRDQDARLVVAGNGAPASLNLREDLRTRLGWGLIYQVHGLSDEEKIDALTRSAQARGIALSPGVLPYLITHWQRDMQSLSAMLNALDAYSLETRRPITLPLLRSLLQRDDEANS